MKVLDDLWSCVGSTFVSRRILQFYILKIQSHLFTKFQLKIVPFLITYSRAINRWFAWFIVNIHLKFLYMMLFFFHIGYCKCNSRSILFAHFLINRSSPCSSVYEDGRFCETFHSNDDGWRDCESCGKVRYLIWKMWFIDIRKYSIWL